MIKQNPITSQFNEKIFIARILPHPLQWQVCLVTFMWVALLFCCQANLCSSSHPNWLPALHSTNLSLLWRIHTPLIIGCIQLAQSPQTHSHTSGPSHTIRSPTYSSLALSLTPSCVYSCQSCFVCSGLTYQICSGGGPSTYISCVGYYFVIADPCVRSVACVVTHLYTLLMIGNIPRL